MSNKSPKELLSQIKSILAESKRHPLEDHPYHSKSDEALKYIIKDAGEAATAMKSHGTIQGNSAESKYLDQVNDAATVLHFRKQHGTPDWYKEKYLKKKVNENVVDFGKEKETREMKQFHSGLMKKVGEKAKERQELIQNHIDSGKFPMKIGTRYTTEHSRKNKLPPWKVIGYHVDPKNPDGRYGYHVERGEGDDKTVDMHLIRDPKLEKLHGPEKWNEFQKGVKPFEKLKSVSEDTIQEVSKELLQRYKEKADTQAKQLDKEAKEGKNPIENIKKITKASKRGLGSFKAHLKLRKMEESLALHDRQTKEFFNSDDASPEELKKLSDHEDSHIRMAVAKHKNTPHDVLNKLASDKSHDVKLGVASNPNTHHDTLHDLSSSTSAYTRAAVAANPSTRKDTLSGLSNDKNDFVSDAIRKRKIK